MQVILGSSGVIGKHVALELSKMKEPVRLVARNPIALSSTHETFKGNLLVQEDVMNAIAGCTVAYVTVGLPYHSKVWERDWPVLMQHVVHACIINSCKLVFFDNVYAYGKVEGWMTEQTPMLATSRKGIVRKLIAEMIFDAVEKKGLQAMIVRAPDFYGPETPLSFLNLMVFERMLKGKSPQVMVSAKRLHSFIYTPDAGRATAFLGNQSTAFNQIWHLPTDPLAMNLEKWVELIGNQLSTDLSIQVLPKWALQILGLFISPIKESMELLYQNEFDYLFSSDKFFKAFPEFEYTRYQEGIKNTLDSYL
jgi:nucleoside-diphosphate-sugar epimerase